MPLKDISPPSAVIEQGTSNQEQMKAKYLEKLGAAQSWLVAHEIPFRFLGSLAFNSYVGTHVDFYRPEKVGYHRFPDVDLLVPRSRIPEVEEFRRLFLQGDVPINFDLFPSHIHFDFRPDEKMSYLTHKGLAVPVPTELFQATTTYVEGLSITTLPAQTLFHTNVVAGGTIRKKDWPKILPLGRYVRDRRGNEFRESDYSGFHDFLFLRRQQYPKDVWMMWFAQTQVPKLPAPIFHFIWDTTAPLVNKYYNQKNNKLNN